MVQERVKTSAMWAAAAVGMLYVAVSVYWGLGGTLLLATVGSSLVKQRPGAVIDAALWGAVLVKLVAAGLPVLVGRRLGPARWLPRLRSLVKLEAVILILYGFVLTVVELLAQAGVIRTGKNADHRALMWHAYLWDPWFLVWGLLVAGAVGFGPPASMRGHHGRWARASSAPGRIADQGHCGGGSGQQ